MEKYHKEVQESESEKGKKIMMQRSIQAEERLGVNLKQDYGYTRLREERKRRKEEIYLVAIGYNIRNTIITSSKKKKNYQRHEQKANLSHNH